MNAVNRFSSYRLRWAVKAKDPGGPRIGERLSRLSRLSPSLLLESLFFPQSDGVELRRDWRQPRRPRQTSVHAPSPLAGGALAPRFSARLQAWKKPWAVKTYGHDHLSTPGAHRLRGGRHLYSHRSVWLAVERNVVSTAGRNAHLRRSLSRGLAAEKVAFG
jgi:hypothetical protein